MEFNRNKGFSDIMKCCCVIGGTGFIGSFVVRALLNEGRSVIVVGRNEHPTRPLPAGVVYVPGDFGDKYFLRGILRGVDEIIDLAYASVPKTSYDNPVQDIFDNLPPAVNLLEVASTFRLDKVLLVSSGGVIYGHAKNIPINEEHSTNPISPYGITKLAVEKYALMFYATRDLPVVCVRPANAYGESQRPFVGQGFVATAIASIQSGQEIILFGETGTIRDYIHAEDIALGILAALNHGLAGEIYNIGSGEGRSNKDILDALMPLAQADGLETRLKTVPLRAFDVPINVLDSSKLSSATGWTPQVSFPGGIKRTWDWFRNQRTGEHNGLVH
jgi:UDP-glucose 4-epimerase